MNKPTIFIDFETGYGPGYSLKTLDPIRYVTDRRFAVLAVAYTVNGGPPVVSPTLPDHIRGYILGGSPIVAHNLAFDGAVLRYHYGLDLPGQLRCTLSAARAAWPRLPNDLAHIARRLGLAAKGDTAEAVPPNTYTIAEGTEQWRRLVNYAAHDITLLREVYYSLPLWVEWDHIDHTLRLALYPTLRWDADRADALAQAMAHERDTTIARGWESIPADLRPLNKEPAAFFRSTIQFPQTLDKIIPGTLPTKPGTNGPIPAIAKSDPAYEHFTNHPDPNVRSVFAARVAAKTWPSWIKRLSTISDQAAAVGGNLPVYMNAYGAHTGRVSGGGGQNLLNLGARQHVLISDIRGCILPPPGKRLAIIDFAAIEARVAPWLAGQDDLLEIFASGRDVYSEIGTRILGRKVRKPGPRDPGPVAERLTRDRFTAKTIVLGCQYGMGWARLKATLARFGVEITETQAREAVSLYRLSVGKICGFWHQLEAAWATAVACPGVRATAGALSFTMADGSMNVTLPSGRVMPYPKAGCDDTDSRNPVLYQGPPINTTWWGGSLLENVTQAVSRDILIHSIKAIESLGYRVPLHIYDEIVAIVDDERDLAAIEEVMTTPPAWATGLPLAVEGHVTDRFCK